MPVSAENLVLYNRLQKKRDALFDYLIELQEQKKVVSEHYVNIEIEKANWERIRVHAVMADLNSNNPIAFPSADQIREMQESVASLQTVIAQGAAWDQLVSAGNAVLSAWPVS